MISKKSTSDKIIDQLKLPKIPEGTITIDDYAFQAKKDFPTIIIPDGVKSIGKYAFAHTDLNYIEIPDSVTSIGEGAFLFCDKLKYIKLSKNIKRIENKTFELCKQLEKIIIPDGVESIGEYAFANCNITKIKIPDSVKSIDSGAFNMCSKLETFICSDIINIHRLAFFWCYRLKYAVIKLSDKKILYARKTYEAVWPEEGEGDRVDVSFDIWKNEKVKKLLSVILNLNEYTEYEVVAKPQLDLSQSVANAKNLPPGIYKEISKFLKDGKKYRKSRKKSRKSRKSRKKF